MQTYQPRWWHRMLQQITSSQIGTWLVYLTFYPLDRVTLRLTRGRHTLAHLLWGLPVLVLTSTGAKSGQLRQTPVLAIIEGDEVVLIASNWGRPHHPGWYHNLRAHPEATLSAGNHTQAFTARQATDTERDKYWPKADALYPGYAAYRRRAKRKIPILVLIPTNQLLGDTRKDSLQGRGTR